MCKGRALCSIACLRGTLLELFKPSTLASATTQGVTCSLGFFHCVVGVASNRNQVRASASSVHFSSKVAVAIFPCSS
jgi:hypothetical protein